MKELPLMKAPRLLWITPPRGSLSATAALAAKAGSNVALLLRRPGANGRQLLRQAEQLRAAAPELSLLVQRLDVALVLPADGVHLPERALSPRAARRVFERASAASMLIGASRHDARGVAQALAEGADYVTLSPVFDSPGKGPCLGLDMLAEVCAAHPGRVVALGGVVDADKARRARRAGAAGVATIRGVDGVESLHALTRSK